MRLAKPIALVSGHLLAMLSVVTAFGVIPAWLIHHANRDAIADANSYAGMSFLGWIGGMAFMLGVACIAFLVLGLCLQFLHRKCGMKNWLPLAVLAASIGVFLLAREVVPPEPAMRLRRLAELAAAFALYWSVIIATHVRLTQKTRGFTTKHSTLSAGAAEP